MTSRLTGRDRLAAEFALGVLAPRERDRAERLIASEDAFRSLVDAWRERLAGLAELAPATPPREGLLDAIHKRIAALDATQIIRRHEGDWRSLGEGVTIKVLHHDPNTGVLSVLLRMQPGATFRDHGHKTTEECLVLEGEVTMNGVVLKEGDHQVTAAGVEHQSIHSATGTLLYLRGTL
jgi:quercetin dioxygenase-like cupin family protein